MFHLSSKTIPQNKNMLTHVAFSFLHSSCSQERQCECVCRCPSVGGEGSMGLEVASCGWGVDELFVGGGGRGRSN